MKQKILFLFLLFSFTSIQAQLLWKITGKNLKNPSYIFASTPYISIAYTDSIKGIFNHFTECKVVIGETALNKIDNEKKIYNAAILPRNTTLEKFITNKDKELFESEILRILKLKFNEISVMKPQIIYNLYRDELIKNTLQINSDVDINSLFQTLATEKGKVVDGVITADDLIKNLSDTTQLQQYADQLIGLIKNRVAFQKEIIHLRAIYKTGNFETFYNQVLESEFVIQKSKSDYLNYLETRNNNWFAKIDEVCKSSSAFIIVDIMQLAGNNGLIQQLKSAGYKVEAAEK